MQRIFDSGVTGRLLLLLILASLLGVSPYAHGYQRDLHNAQRALGAGFPRAAADHIAQAAIRLPAREGLWEQAGRYALEGGDPGAALAYLGRAQGEGFTPGGWTLLGDAYAQTGDLRAATQAWQTGLEVSGPSKALYKKLLAAQMDLYDYPQAIVTLRKLILLQPRDPNLTYQLGLLLAATDPEAALAYLAQAAALQPEFSNSAEQLRRSITTARLGNDPAYSLLASGRALASIGRWDLAAEAFRQSTLVRPDYAEAWAYLGEARQHRSGAERGDALAELQRAIQIDPQSLAANVFSGLYWKRQEAYDQALASFQAATRLEPQNPALQIEIGDTYAIQGQLGPALEAYRTAVDLAPRDWHYRKYLAQFVLENNLDVRGIALPAARQAVLLAPRQPDTLNLMAQTLLRLNDRINAERFLHRALQVDPDFAQTHLNLGLLYLMRGENRQAYAELNLARSTATDEQIVVHSERLLNSYFP